MQMATLDKAEALLEDLRSASWDAAVKDLEDVKAFAAKQVSQYYCTPCPYALSSSPSVRHDVMQRQCIPRFSSVCKPN